MNLFSPQGYGLAVMAHKKHLTSGLMTILENLCLNVIFPKLPLNPCPVKINKSIASATGYPATVLIFVVAHVLA